MDFELIDELNDEDVMNLFNDYTIDGHEKFISSCVCQLPNGYQSHYGLNRRANCHSMFNDGLTSASLCRNWCIDTRGFDWKSSWYDSYNNVIQPGFSNNCFCPVYEEAFGAYGRIYTCPQDL